MSSNSSNTNMKDFASDRTSIFSCNYYNSVLRDLSSGRKPIMSFNSSEKVAFLKDTMKAYFCHRDTLL